MSGAEAVSAFTCADATCLREWAQQARSIVRAVALAVAAQKDGSVSYEDDGSLDRWWAALDLVCAKVMAVRDLLSGRSGAPVLDWFTPLSVVEALGAASWHSTSSPVAVDRLDAEEIQLSLGVAAECLDLLANECADACTKLSGRAA